MTTIVVIIATVKWLTWLRIFWPMTVFAILPLPGGLPSQFPEQTTHR